MATSLRETFLTRKSPQRNPLLSRDVIRERPVYQTIHQYMAQQAKTAATA